MIRAGEEGRIYWRGHGGVRRSVSPSLSSELSGQAMRLNRYAGVGCLLAATRRCLVEDGLLVQGYILASYASKAPGSSRTRNGEWPGRGIIFLSLSHRFMLYRSTYSSYAPATARACYHRENHSFIRYQTKLTLSRIIYQHVLENRHVHPNIKTTNYMITHPFLWHCSR